LVEVDQATGTSTLVIKRRTWLQDAVRVYKVFLDDTIVGSIGPFRTKSFTLNPGKHVVRLAMPTTGRSSSDDIELDVSAGERWVVRTVRRGGLLSFLKLPLALPEGAQALAEKRPINSRYYRRPWIHVNVERVEP
jgi:hypothetical protein